MGGGRTDTGENRDGRADRRRDAPLLGGGLGLVVCFFLQAALETQEKPRVGPTCQSHPQRGLCSAPGAHPTLPHPQGSQAPPRRALLPIATAAEAPPLHTVKPSSFFPSQAFPIEAKACASTPFQSRGPVLSSRNIQKRSSQEPPSSRRGLSGVMETVISVLSNAVGIKPRVRHLKSH